MRSRIPIASTLSYCMVVTNMVTGARIDAIMYTSVAPGGTEQ